MKEKKVFNEKDVKGVNYVLGEPKSRKEVLEEIEKDESAQRYFQRLNSTLQEELISFCMGNRGLKITYDPFFKYIFNPSVHPERLSELLSLILGEEVEVVDAIPNESDRVTEKGSLLITDILVRLKDGSYANVEIQKMGYSFPGQRCACYSADLLIRQLARVKRMAREENRKFSYCDLKKVYTIVFVEESTSTYWKHPQEYIHRGKAKFDTGLKLDLLQEYIMIPLDIFKNMPHNTIERIDAWLYFIGSDEPKDILRVVETYPEFIELYKELIGLRFDVKGLTGMFDYYRQLLREADEGTLHYMVEERKKQIAEQDKQIAEQDKQIAEQDKQIAEQDKQIADLKKQLVLINQELTKMKLKVGTV